MPPSVSKTGVAKTSGIYSTLPASGVEHFLLKLADPINTTLDLDTLLHTVAELVRQVIPFEIFAILLVNERSHDLRMRFQIGHAPEVERLRIKIGNGITGRAVERRETVLVSDVMRDPDYINAHPDVKSELAVPLIAKNRVIGVIDIQSSQQDYFKEEHSRLLTLVASRIAAAIENARL
jgi:sigma-B regulation protein RsbU (phosphoserine phosphatase)